VLPLFVVLLLPRENHFDPAGKGLREIPEKVSRGVVRQVSARVEQLVGSSDVGFRLRHCRNVEKDEHLTEVCDESQADAA
jgi:hypothetical protein